MFNGIMTQMVASNKNRQATKTRYNRRLLVQTLAGLEGSDDLGVLSVADPPRPQPDIDSLKSALLREKQIIQRHTTQDLADVTVIIRADENAKTGLVQEIIQACQDLKFERFALRGKTTKDSTISPPQ